MTGGTYQPLARSSSDDIHFTHTPSYPPSSPTPPHSHGRAGRGVLLVVARWVLMGLGALSLAHFLLLAVLPSHAGDKYRSTVGLGSSSSAGSWASSAEAADLAQKLAPGSGQPGLFFRDPAPGHSAAAFWKLAEQEIAASGRDTCNDQLGRALVDAYGRSKTLYCSSGSASAPFALDSLKAGTHHHWTPSDPVPEDERRQAALCMPVHRDDVSKWWPFAASPCVSTNLRPGKANGKFTGEGVDVSASQCKVTEDGERLKHEMGHEVFLGSVLNAADEDEVECSERIEHTLLLIHRQDQWNPFHVAEDLITTLVTLFIADAAVPGIQKERLQLVFTDNYAMDGNHFTALYDRMGAWAPRRLQLDPWAEGTCFTNVIHSVGAGASLLSAMGVGKSNRCASSITWAAAHYYRHLFGLLPRSLRNQAATEPAAEISEPQQSASTSADDEDASDGPDIEKRATRTTPVNILWLSRAKLDAYAQAHNDWSVWRDVRKLHNEKEVLARVRRGLEEMCAAGPSDAFPNGCVYEDAQDEPETWPNEAAHASGPVPVRFATLDPTVHALETQVHFLGHTSVLVGQHGGAMGLGLFLPPGEGALLELQVREVAGNYHFEHIAFQTGHEYEAVRIGQTVDVDAVWDVVRRHVEEEARKVY